ncbi:MAG: M48 family metallopeptidase [Betaproteobacteria bacterium]
MDFFEHQQAARRNTRVMILLYLLAVAGVVVAVDLVLAGIFLNVADVELRPGLGAMDLLRLVPKGVYAWGAIGTVGVILTASTLQIMQLAEGGSAVAEMVGARSVAAETSDPLERRLLNVIEEMAIASGVRVPRAYVMPEERGINAFAAGYDVSNAVIAVTRGTLETLSRDELQGVIAHEFSHILNGDMWLNIKMLGVLAGIVFLGGIGTFLMRTAPDSDDGKATVGLFAVGFLLFVIGYVGMFFARLIKASVSRQREFLADASAVQFTRNPDGIAGALDQIRASVRGALVTNRFAEDMSHMYFGQGIEVWLSGLFDTHPPLEERIARVRPGFHATRYRRGRAEAGVGPTLDGAGVTARVTAGSTAGFSPFAAAGQRASDAGNAWGRSAAQSAGLVGTLDAEKVDYAAQLLAGLAPELRSAMREAEGAGAVMVATLLAPRQEVMQLQLAGLHAAQLGALGERAAALMPLVSRLGRGFDLLLIDLCLPAVKQASDEDKGRIVGALEAAVHADRRVSLHEFVVLTLVKTQLASRRKPGSVRTRPLSALRNEIVLALSLVALAGRKPGADPAFEREAEAAVAAGAKAAGLTGAQLLAKEVVSLEAAGRALRELMTLAPLAKAVLIKALFTTVTADGTIRLMEAELMRMVGAVLECPLPPLIEAVDPATLAA